MKLLWHLSLAVGVVATCLGLQRVYSTLQRSVVIQALTYLSRPHDGVVPLNLSGPHIWRGDELDTSSWRTELTTEQLADVVSGVAHARKTTRTLEHLTREDCPFPLLSSQLDAWRNATLPGIGLGFAVISGLDAAVWNITEQETFFWCLGLHLGRPGAQNGRGELLGHVRDEFRGGRPSSLAVRQYRTNEAITWHCDPADVVMLYCLTQGSTGGASRLVSSGAVYNAVVHARPDLAGRFFEPTLMDSRGDGGVSFFYMRPARFFAGVLRLFFHAEYFLTAYNHPDAPMAGMGPPQDVRDLVDAVAAAADSPGMALAMDFKPGDVQIVSNHVVMHSRDSFEDGVDVDGPRRHLLRLWLSNDDPTWVGEGWQDNLLARASAASSMVEVIGSLVWGRLRPLFTRTYRV